MDNKKLEKLLRNMDEDIKVPKNLAAKITKHVEKHAGEIEIGLETDQKPFWANFNIPFVFTAAVASFAVVLMFASYMPGGEIEMEGAAEDARVAQELAFDEAPQEVLRTFVESESGDYMVSTVESGGSSEEFGIIVEINPVSKSPGYNEVVVRLENGDVKTMRVPDSALGSGGGNKVGDEIGIMDKPSMGGPDIQTN